MSLENYPGFLLNFSECEMTGESKHYYLFKSFRLNVAERQLLHNDSPVSLTPKAFDVLKVLMQKNGHLVEKDELLKQVQRGSGLYAILKRQIKNEVAFLRNPTKY